MKKIDYIKQEWFKVFEEVSLTAPFQKIAKGEVTVEHYKAVMRQVFHHARENPQIQALATVYFKGKQRELVKGFYRHAISEIGHDQLALNDIKSLGVDVSEIPFERPLPATTALISYAFYQIQHLNPIGYLGYLFHLEFMPTRSGKAYMELFKKIGVPSEAMTFIQDHSTIDIGHNKLMEDYVEKLIQTEDDMESVIYAIKTTAKLYANMIDEAFAQVDNKKDYGISRLELARSGRPNESGAAAEALEIAVGE